MSDHCVERKREGGRSNYSQSVDNRQGDTALTSKFNQASVLDPTKQLQEFHEVHENWFAPQQSAEGFVYALPMAHFDKAVALFRIDPGSRRADAALASLCALNLSIGLSINRFIKCAQLQSPIPWPNDFDLSDFLNLGWTRSDIAAVKSLNDPTAKIHKRLRSAAGRLISMPTFIAERNELLAIWQRLPIDQRPPFPIARSMRLVAAVDLVGSRASDELADFIARFDRFCDDWHLLGMVSWELPDVRGPRWVPGIASDDSLRHGSLTVTTPWHFPVLAEDGLGRIVEEEHRRLSAQRGILDVDSWETYATLFDLHYWEYVFSQRYSQQQRIVKFKIEMESVIAGILNLSVTRVQKLRKWLHALQRGSLKSLLGKR